MAPPQVSSQASVTVCDVALLGTGLAPLLAAAYLVTRGKSVLLLNPQSDFFLENSELPLDPLAPLGLPAFMRSSPERALESLRPHFPGAVEHWSGAKQDAGFHDWLAPHIRTRGRLVIGVGSEDVPLEDLYLQASEGGLNPQLWEGVQAIKRLPGAAQKGGSPVDKDLKGLYLPRSCDFDITRYRNGVLEFVRERVSADSLVGDASQIELIDGGVRFHAQGVGRTAQFHEGMIVFWTPALTQWVQAQAKELEAKPIAPRGVRLWEQWSLVSREKPDPSLIAMLEGLSVWAEVEGSPDDAAQNERAPNRLSVLRRGPLLSLDQYTSPAVGLSWASERSFQDLSKLCTDYLGWQEISIRKLTARAIFEWGSSHGLSWKLTGRKRGRPADAGESPPVIVQGGCDGPLVEVVDTARAACETLLAAGGGAS